MVKPPATISTLPLHRTEEMPAAAVSPLDPNALQTLPRFQESVAAVQSDHVGRHVSISLWRELVTQW